MTNIKSLQGSTHYLGDKRESNVSSKDPSSRISDPNVCWFLIREKPKYSEKTLKAYEIFTTRIRPVRNTKPHKAKEFFSREGLGTNLMRHVHWSRLRIRLKLWSFLKFIFLNLYFSIFYVFYFFSFSI